MSITKLTAVARLAATAALVVNAVPDATAHSYLALPPPHSVGIYPVVAQYRIVHACSPVSGTKVRPVIAQSFLIPTLNPILSRADGGTIDDTDKNGKVDLSDLIQSGGLQGVLTPFVNHSVFTELQRKSGSFGNTIGFSGTGGRIPDQFWAEIPFNITPVFFVAGSCASELVVHPVGADICRITSSPEGGDVNIWMEHTTAKFPNDVHGIGENTLRISFKRSQEYNPMKKRCGAGYTVDVFASDEDIDANLPIPGVWPKP